MGPGISNRVRAGFQASFIQNCVRAIQLGHDKMLAAQLYSIEWDEDNLTLHLVDAMKQTGFLRQLRISVNYQAPIIIPEMVYEGADFLEAPRVDFKLSTWIHEDEVEFYAEAKNLSQHDWTKSTGTRVRASHYRARYLETGIENYLSERYPDGCLVGYVVNGNSAAVAVGLNRLITKRCLKPRVGHLVALPPPTWPARYHSTNLPASKPVVLIHLLLQLT
jgi:hypothetical protein